MKPIKSCIECDKDLARHWGNNFCEKCFRQLLTDHLAEEDKRHEMQAMQKAFENT